MLKLGCALSAVVLISSSAFAERIVLKNANKIPVGAKVIKTFSTGENRWTVIETEQSVENLVQMSVAEAASPDLRIGLVGSAKKLLPNQNDGWHIDRLHYDQIPKGINGKGIVVAVIDTGIDENHSALKNHLWTNPGEIAGNGIDDDGDGYVDDVIGYNFVERNGQPADDYDHGTHCAGIIAASPNRAKTARGVAPGVKIMALRIIGSKDTGFLSDAAEAVAFAVDHGAKVLSNSWRVYQSWNSDFDQKGADLMRSAIQYAGSKGAIFVAAAGNEGVNLDTLSDPMIPAGMLGLSNMLVVSATEPKDVFAEYSNFGPGHVHVAAPGTDILSTVRDGKWDSFSGTSMATPLVAGVLALGLQNGQSSSQIISRLMNRSEKISGWETNNLSGGIINILDFLN